MIFHIRHTAETNSTNEDVARELGTPGGDGLVVVADFQRRGTGRKGRPWVAPAGSALLFTAALPRSVPLDVLWVVPFWTALAVGDAMAAFGVTATLQWPNDLLLAGRKVGGILCISRVCGDRAHVGCGVGINLRRVDDPALRDLEPPPAFLSDRIDVDASTLLDAILLQFERSLALLDAPATIAERWQRAANVPGVRYRILADDATDPFEATALRLAENGSLVVDDGRGERTVSLADARILRH